MSALDNFPTWPHLENLERILRDRPLYLESLADVPEAQWYITEKLHGFNARFGKTADGVTWAGSRNRAVETGDVESWDHKHLNGFVRFAAIYAPDLAPGITIFGEWAGKGIQKGIDYGAPDFHAFGLMRVVNEVQVLQDMAKLFQLCAALEVKHVPLLGYGRMLPDRIELDELRKAKSAIAEQGREGIVLFPWPVIEDEYGHPLIAKHKAPEFAETAHARKEQPAPANLENIQAFVDEYATLERFRHIMGQALEEGPYDPFDQRMIGTILRLMYADVVREGQTDFDALSKEDQKLLGRVLTPVTKRMLDAERDYADTD